MVFVSFYVICTLVTFCLDMRDSSFVSHDSILAVREDKEGQLVNRPLEESDREEPSPSWSLRPRDTRFRQLEEIMVASASRSACSIFIG